MKKRSRKTTSKVAKKCSLSVTALIALGICVGSSLQGGECHPNSNGDSKGKKSVSSIQHEMVPHVVLPETIQYNKISKSHRTHPGISTAGDYGMVSPYVATYTPFPSYQLPLAAQMKAVNQSVYPVSPLMQALPLPQKGEKDGVNDKDRIVTENIVGKAKQEDVALNEKVLEEKEFPESDTDVAPILLASGREEVVHAAPLSPLSNEVTQTGIFCQKPAKPPAAWSFSSPIFKAASVPMGWGSAGHTGYISQYGPRGCQTQVGFQPMGQMGAPAMMQQGMMPPMKTFQTGPGAGMDNGPQIQMLPNGMLMVTMPPNHARCGLLRCRCGNQPRTLFLPAGPGGMPGMMPQPSTPAAPEAMMMHGMPGMMAGMMSGGMDMMGGMPISPVAAQGMPGMANPMAMQQQMMMQQMQPQMMPVTMMTQFGPMVVGYRPMPAMNPMMPPMMGAGMMQADYARQMVQQAQMAQQQYAQAMQQKALEADATDESKEEGTQEPKAPLPINSPMLSGMGMMANPYAMYAQQAGLAAQNEDASCDADAMAQMMPQMMFFPPQMMMPQMQMPQMIQGGNQFAGMYMTPYGMMSMTPMNGMGSMGYGMMNPGMMPQMMNVGYGQQPMMNQGGMSMSDVVQLVMMLNNNNNGKRERRFRLFQRIAERREARRDRRSQDDPLNMLMQAWSTPYMPADSVVRMPSRNAYPYGYFGAQVGPQDTANYGGFYNLYMGNTSYPGLY